MFNAGLQTGKKGVREGGGGGRETGNRGFGGTLRD